ncbi:unnamed protein product [Moneuplotes crassus]|uniref:Uncharacterized protein n=1 Tax=Euplotes crassus TaxID=5936 RepID=A0AAD1XYE6_EUPCR|nr:unnamed protein product [Moneuplotes crassus]
MAQSIKKFRVLLTDSSFEGGELTLTLKRRRRLTLDKYSEAIDGMYIDQDVIFRL